jgi:hypothetical protein
MLWYRQMRDPLEYQLRQAFPHVAMSEACVYGQVRSSVAGGVTLR